MSETKSYQGSCHCGAVKYTVNLDLSKPVISCNCSICGRTGTLLAFVPVAEFTLLSGEDSLTDYLFGRKHIHHTFCKTCGVRSFCKGEMAGAGEIRAINTRCLEGVDISTLTVQHFDGKSR